MTDMEARFLSRMKELEETDWSRYLAMIAILQVLAGEGHLEKPDAFTRGDCKRAIRAIRAIQRHQNYLLTDSEASAAVSMIRRDWLHRPIPTNRKGEDA